MRWYRDHEGTQQVYLKDAEIDEITEGELRKAGLMPTVDTCRVDIEVFVERHLGAHLDLGAALDDDVLGVTELRRGEPARILINRDLTDSAFEIDEYSGTLGRWRATLAHEGTHVLLHGFLFDLDPDQQSMFAETIADDRLVRCYKRDTSFAGRSRDRESSRQTRAWPRCSCLDLSSARPREILSPLLKRPRRSLSTCATFRSVASGRPHSTAQLSGFLSSEGTATTGLFP